MTPILVLDSRTATIDEYGRVRSQREALEKRETLLKKEIASWMPADLAGADSWSFSGSEYVIGVSPCAWERALVSIRKLYRYLGMTKFMDACTFSLTKFDALVPEGQRDQFLTTPAQTGSRRWTVVKTFRDPDDRQPAPEVK